MEIEKLLDECKDKLDVKSDYALAKKLVIHAGLISDYRAGKREPDEYACLKIAEVLGLDAEALMVHFAARKAKNPKVREYLQKYSERLGGLAAAIFIVVTFIVTPTPSQAAPVLDHEGAVCILCKMFSVAKRQIKQTALSLVSQISHFCMSVSGIRQIPA